MAKLRKHIQNNNGFTLVEMMVTVFLTAIAVISIYRGYTAFSQGADAQQQVMEMQQNLRIGMTRMVAEIRRAGMDEEGTSEAGFLSETNATSIEFSMDLGSGGVFRNDNEDNDGDGDEDDGDPATNGNDDPEAEEEDRIGDGDVDDDGERVKYYLNGEDLMREVWDSGAYGTAQTVISNVLVLEFLYFDDSAAPVQLNPVETPPGSGVWELSTTDRDIIDKVEITMVVRTTNEDFRFTDTTKYENLQGTVIYDAVTEAVGDEKHLRRRAFSMSVQIRNNI